MSMKTTIWKHHFFYPKMVVINFCQNVRKLNLLMSGISCFDSLIGCSVSSIFVSVTVSGFGSSVGFEFSTIIPSSLLLSLKLIVNFEFRRDWAFYKLIRTFSFSVFCSSMNFCSLSKTEWSQKLSSLTVVKTTNINTVYTIEATRKLSRS